jgi:DNA-directed RNA polymerase subunit E'/Rpb7
MYILVELKDSIRISPNLFNRPQTEAICDELNRKLANRVIIHSFNN